MSHHRSADSALGKLLLKLSIIDEKQLIELRAIDPKSNQSLISYAASLGFCDQRDALNLVSQKLGIQYVEVTKSNINTLVTFLDQDLLNKIPLNDWRKFEAAPVGKDNGRLVIALANPFDHELKHRIDFTLGEPIRVAIASQDDIKAILTKRETANVAANREPLFDKIQMLTPDEEKGKKDDSVISASDINTAPVIRLVNQIMLEAFERSASDIHISPEQDELKVRIRVDGILHDLMSVPNSLAKAVTSRIKLMAGMNIAEHRKPQDGRVKIKTGSNEKDLRISTLPTMYGENIVARVLSSELGQVTFGTLGMPEKIQEQFTKILKGSSRVILITGPTGSGKTSSLYAGITLLNDGHTHIITVEDPIEYRVQGVNQIQVNPKVGLTFADGLRSILRQDPDVVVIGEIRDSETASIALQVAQTGHLVLSSLHTNSAPAAITRLKDLKVPGYLIASSVQCVMAQRLVRRLCPHCATSVDPSTAPRYESLNIYYQSAKKAVGCDECGGLGFSGRVGIFSLLDLNDHLRSLVRNDTGEYDLQNEARQYGFKTLEEASLELVKEGVTSLDEVERVLGPISLPAPVKTTKAPSQSSQPTLHKKSILLVEDDDNMRAVLSMVLERAHYQVLQAASGAEAINSLQQQLPDLVICDLMMPNMSGTEVISVLRAQKATRTLPVLMLTAAATEDNELAGISCGADDFVSKTADKRILLSRINRLLSRSDNS